MEKNVNFKLKSLNLILNRKVKNAHKIETN